MRIVIDLQGAQTESRYRGIGRYSLNLAQAIARNAGDHEIIIALNGLFPETIEPVRTAFEGLLPQDNIRVWYAPGPVKESQPGNEQRRKVAELIRENFLACLNPDVVLITSLFEGYNDDAVTIASSPELNARTAAIFHDLIPMLYPNQYLFNQSSKDWYARVLNYLKSYPLLLSNSEHTRQDGIKHLALPENNIKAIFAAVDSKFKPINLTAEQKLSIKKSYGISDSYILFIGGLEPRKNADNLIAAHSKLPASFRKKYQLLIIGPYSKEIKLRSETLIKSQGVSHNRLLFCGRVSDDHLVTLYNMASVFVFPSIYEGFGLPPLEAMSCGVPTIGSNCSSIPEVIGLEEALFDPYSIESISNKVEEVLANDDFRSTLIDYGLQQAKKFSWNYTANSALEAMEEMVVYSTKGQTKSFQPRSLDHTASYTSLIDNIALVMHKGSTNDDDLNKAGKAISKNLHSSISRQLFLDVSELSQRDAGTGVQRVVSNYLRELLDNPPKDYLVEPVYATINDGYRYASKCKARMLGFDDQGCVEEYMKYQRGDIFFALDMQHDVQLAQEDFFIELKKAGVYVVFLVHDLLPIELPHMFCDEAAKEDHEKWLTLISKTNGAICVSKTTVNAYADWLSQNSISPDNLFTIDWVHNGADIQAALSTSGMPDNAERILSALKEKPTFLVVGTIEPRKGCHQVLECFEKLWDESQNINLIFVGKMGWKMDWFVQKILNHQELNKRLYWLNQASDQLLSAIYNESTCLIAASVNEGFGLPLVESAQHGLPVIARDIPVFREVAGDYAFYFDKEAESQEIAAAINGWLQLFQKGEHPRSDQMPFSTWQESACKLKEKLVTARVKRKQLLVDISELAQHDARTGIQRVVRSILKELILNPPENYSVEPIYSPPGMDTGYYYATKFLHQHDYICKENKYASQHINGKSDSEVFIRPGDIYFSLDFRHDIVVCNHDLFDHLKKLGVPMYFLMHDILPVLYPSFFPEGTKEAMLMWLNSIAPIADGVICISKQTATAFEKWLASSQVRNNIIIDYSHLGADLENSMPSKGLPENAGGFLSTIKNGISFLMVGTLEPRKGYMQVLLAFERLWKLGLEVELVIIGKQGWMIDNLIDKLKSSPQRNKKLFWLEGISDEYLEKVYQASTCLIAASYAEGFGLPLIEAAQHRKPIIARDIPVFREVAGEHAYYFHDSKNPKTVANAVLKWLELYKQDLHPKSEKMPWLTWEESTKNLIQLLALSGKTTF